MSDVSRGVGWWQASDGKWYPPRQAPPPPPQPFPPFEPPYPSKPLHRRAWFWPLVAVIVVIAGCKAIVVGAGVWAHNETHQINTIVYSVTGSSSDADVTFETDRGPSQDSNVQLPWKRTVSVTGITILNLGVTLGADGGSVRCTIVDDGTVVTTSSARGAFATIDCNSTRP